jgi:MFS family permease
VPEPPNDRFPDTDADDGDGESRAESLGFATAMLSVAALLSGTALIILGGGLYGTLLPIRATIEGFDAVTVAIIMAAFYVGFVFGTHYCVNLIDSVGHIRVYAALSAIASAASLAHALIIEPITWAVLRGIAGFCFAGLYMIVESWLNARSEDDTRGRILSAYMAVNLAALAVGQTFLLLAPTHSFELFVLVSILISLATVPIALSRAPAPAVARTARLPIRELFVTSPLGTIGCLAAGVATGAWWSLAPVVIFTVENSETNVAIYMMATILGGLAAQWPVGRLSDRYDRRDVLLGVAFVATLAAIVLAFFLGRSYAALVASGVFQGATVFCIYALSVAHANDRHARDGIVALSAGLLLIYGVGAITGSIAAGAVVKAMGPSGLFVFCAAVCGALTLYGIRRKLVSPPIPIDEQADFVIIGPRSTPVAAELDPRAGQPAE